MHMTSLDWIVVAGVLGVFVFMAVLATRLTRSVSDYLVAGRSAGRYMLTIASGMEWIGAINIVAMFQVYYTGGAWYCAMSNVPAQAFLGSGKTAHEQRMGYLLAQLSWQGLLVFFMVIVLCSFKLMHDPADTAAAAKVAASMQAAPAEVHDQIRVTSALPAMLPAGLVGLFCAIMMAALISSHNGFMHAWGGVLLQDIILPFRKTPLGTRAHLWALRASIAAVGVIAFVYSMLWKPDQSILMYFAMVNNVWLGPAGAVMLGGLYWKKGTTSAAGATLSCGAALGIAHIVLRWGWPTWTGAELSINSQWVFLLTILFSIALYVGVSLVDYRKAFNMDKMLNRGEYAVAGEELPTLRPTRWWQTFFGITPMFNRRDRVTAYLIVGYFMFWLGVFCVGMVYGTIVDPGEAAWAKFWHVYIYISAGLLVCTTVWLGIGGIRDLMSLFRSLRSADRDYSDTGEVKHENV